MTIHYLKNKFFKYQLPAIFWTILTFILSSSSKFSSPDLNFPFQDKFHHLIYYTIYGFLLSLAFFRQEKYPYVKNNFMLIAILTGSIYGFSDEFHQYFVVGRTMDFWDWIADSIGVTIGGLCFQLLLNIQNKKNIK